MLYNSQRKVPVTVFIKFLFDRPRAFVFGLMTTIFSLLMSIPFVVIFSIISQDQPDFDYIFEYGKDTKGTVISKEVDYSMSINNVNPVILTYEYEVDAIKVKDSFQTMSIMTVQNIQIGDNIALKYLEGDSIIPDLRPTDFPFWIVYILDFIIVIIGLPFIYYSLHGALKKKKLYSIGQVREAKIISMAPVGNYSYFSFLKDRFKVNYSHYKSNGKESYGESTTTDLSLINEKRKGDTIAILYDPSDEDSNCVIDDVIMIKCSQGYNKSL